MIDAPPALRRPATLVTTRLTLRPFVSGDLEALVAMHADPEVMRYLGPQPSRAECAAMLERILAHYEQHGFGWLALEERSRAGLVGTIALHVPRFALPFQPCVEVAWRLDRRHWGRGFATEAGHAALEHGFSELGLPEIVSYTACPNLPSQRVMERLGMQRDPAGDFLHPKLPADHPLAPHVLYRLRRPGC